MMSDIEARALYDRLVSDHAADLYALAFRLTGRREVAEDLVQEACTEAWRSLAALRDQAHARAWLMQILRHRWLHWRRARSRSPVEEGGLELVRDSSLRSPKKTSLLQRPSMGSLVQRQFYPIPRIAEGRLFSNKRMANAMIDLSDGLASDLRHICEESRVGAVVEEECLPLSDALVEYAREVRKDPLKYALTGGEDFELLFTVPEGKVSHLVRLSRQKRLKLTKIGKILSRSSGGKCDTSR